MKSIDKALDVAVVGPGLIGSRHISLIKRNADFRLVALVGPDSDANVAQASEATVPLLSDIETLFASSSPDAIIISSPNEFHFVQAMACLERRIPVLVEKPLTDKLGDAKRLVELSEATGVPLLVGHHRTYSPLLQAANEFLISAEFGKMVALTGSALFYKPSQYFLEGPWRTVRGGGPILINLIHEIGLMRNFAGEISSVFAFSSNSTRGFEVEDSVAISVRFASGALGTFMLSDTAASSKSWEMTSGENVVYPHFEGESCWHFAGTRGSLDFPGMRFRTYSSDSECSWWKPFEAGSITFQRQDPLVVQLQHFTDVIRGRSKPRVSARDGYENLLVIEAIRRSIISGASSSINDLKMGIEQ